MAFLSRSLLRLLKLLDQKINELSLTFLCHGKPPQVMVYLNDKAPFADQMTNSPKRQITNFLVLGSA